MGRKEKTGSERRKREMVMGDVGCVDLDRASDEKPDLVNEEDGGRIKPTCPKP